MSITDLAIKRIENYPFRPILVFLHDSLGCIELWREFPKRLGELTQCNVLIYDRQGYGKSSPFSHSSREMDYLEKEADILNQLLNHLRIENCILFGHSDGGSIALIAASKYSVNIRGIITEGAHTFVEELTLRGIQKAVELYKTTNLKIKLEKYHGDKTEEMFWAWANTWTSREFRSWNIEYFLPSVDCPSLIIQGQNDEYGTLKQVETIVKQTKGNSSPYIIPNVKHSPHREVHGLVLARASEFIYQLI